MAFTKFNKNSLSDPKTLQIWNETFPKAVEFFPAKESIYKFFYLNHPGFPADDDQEVVLTFHMSEDGKGSITWAYPIT